MRVCIPKSMRMKHLLYLHSMMRIVNLQRKSPSTFIWCSYDEQFRCVKVVTPIPWPILNSQILSDAEDSVRFTQTKTKNENLISRERSISGRVNDKHCYSFNKQSGCKNDRCKYIHKCAACNIQGHPIFKCIRQKNSNDRLRQKVLNTQSK